MEKSIVVEGNVIPDWTALQFHTASLVDEMMSADEFSDLKRDIETNGYDRSKHIVLDIEDGEVVTIEGRNRGKACDELGVTPTFRMYDPKPVKDGGDGDDRDAFVDRANKHRRQYTREQLLARASREASRGKGERISNPPIGGFEIPRKNTEKTTSKPAPTQKQAAKKAGVGVRTVQRRVTVQKTGIPQLQEAVDGGIVSVSDAATIADQPADVQALALADVQTGKAKTLAEAVEKLKTQEDEAPQLTDAEDNPVPEVSVVAFKNLEKFHAIDSLIRSVQKGIDELARIPGGEQLKRQLQAHTNDEKLIFKSEHLNNLIRDLKHTRPHAVCPYCAGKATKECKGCSGTGWVTKTTWQGAEDSIKARLAT